MYSANVVAIIKKVQIGLKYLALVYFTGYLWPQQAIVTDGVSYDYIIVGAGTAGSVIANRLTEDENISVLLIEAGGDPPLESILPGGVVYLKRSQYDWNYTAENDLYSKKCHQKPFFELSLGKMLGGTTHNGKNYMIYSRGQATDYDKWANITNDSTWKWENVLPYFKKSERIEDPDILNSADIANHGTDGLMRLTKDDEENIGNILESFNELGHHILNDPVSGLGYSKMLINVATGSRQSSSFAFLRPVKDRKNLHVLKNTLVTKINFDQNKNAVGVQAITEDGNPLNIKATEEVIVSAGVFNSAKLLMLSGIGPKKDLEDKKINVISDLPVGQNLQDHIGVVISHAMEKSEAKPINPYKFQASPIIGFIALDKSQNYPDYETMSFSAHANMILYFCSFAYRLSYDVCDTNHASTMGKMGLFNEIINLHPKSRGEVTLRSSNPMDPPVITTGYLSDEADLDDLVKYVKDFIPIVNTTYFRSIGAKMINPPTGRCDNFERNSDGYWKCYASCVFSGLSNFCGTCAMGRVVDSRLRVYGVQRLRVADASIMPVITRGNTNGPVMMIGEKAADFIKEDTKMDC